jgi:hypothetical protein
VNAGTRAEQYQNVLLKPNFFYQPAPWKEAAAARRCPLH